MYLATAGESLRLHGTDDYKRTLEYKPRLDGRKGNAVDLSWSSDGRYFGAVCKGWPKVEIIKFDGDYEAINLYRCLNVENPTSITFSKQGEGTLAVGNKEGVVSYFNCKSKDDPLLKFPYCKNKVTSLDFSSSDSAIAAGTTQGEVYICGIKSGKLLDKRELTWRQAITSVKFHHSRKGILAAGCNKGSVTIWDIHVGTVVKQFSCHDSPCKGIVFSPNNITFMASVGYDFVLNFFDIKTKSIIYKSSIPEAGSSLDLHCDGTTLAVGTISGAVFIYDVRKMSSPREQFTSLSGCINRLAFQPSSLVRKRRSRGPQECLKKQIFKPLAQLERTNSSNSSCDSLFSPIQAVTEPQIRGLREEDAENSFTCESYVSSILPKEEALAGNVVSDDSVFSAHPSETPSSVDNFHFIRPLFSASEVISPILQVNGKSLLENNEATPVESFSSGLGTLDARSKISDRSLKISQAENLSDDHNRDLLGSSSVAKCPEVSSVHLSVPKRDSRKSNQSSIVKTPLKTPMKSPMQTPMKTPMQTPMKTPMLPPTPMKTPRLLDLPSAIVTRVGDGRGDSNDIPSDNRNLLSFLEPLNSTFNATQSNEVTSAMPITPKKAEKSLNFLLKSPSLNLMESKQEEAANGMEVEDNSEREVLDILNKYSISNMGENVSNASASFNESEMEDVKEVAPVAQPSWLDRVINKVQEEEKEENAPSFPLEMKKYMDEMYKDLCYELKKELSTMHIFNVSAHAKQEILLHKILSELKKEKVDKCVGTDERF